MEHSIPAPEQLIFCSRYWMNICMTIRKSLFYFVVIAVFLHLIFISSVRKNGTSYVIRLKENGILRGKASDLVDELDEITRNNKVDYAVVYGEFMYKAKSWLTNGVWYARLKSRKTRWLHVHLCCHKHGFLTRVSYQILLQARLMEKLHQRK